MKLSRWLRLERNKLGLSVGQMSKILNMQAAWLEELERGKANKLPFIKRVFLKTHLKRLINNAKNN